MGFTLSRLRLTVLKTLLPCFLFLYFPALAGKQILYGSVGEGGVNPGTTTLVILDQTTGGLKETIGEIGYRLNGLAFDPSTGNLYGTTSTNDPNFPRGLVIIDQTTGAGTPIGTNWVQPIVCLTCDASGQLYGWQEWRPGPQDDLVTVDKDTGTFIKVGEAGISTRGQSLDFDQSGTLYLLNQVFPPPPSPIYTISLVDGLATQVGTYSVPTDIAHHGKFNQETWEFWAIGDWKNDNPRNLYIIDINTGDLIGSLPTVDELHTIAFAVINNLEISGIRKKDSFLTETDYYNVISWSIEDPQNIQGFRVYRKDGDSYSLIAELPATAMKYVDHNRKRKASDEYMIEVIDVNGSVSDSATIVITP
ncbi:hypothetical protein [Simkania sp.]|uniref:hypothetical protein n=1 Tax=Simkania sp. TaxID=34094 RepID=UPI003B5228C4